MSSWYWLWLKFLSSKCYGLRWFFYFIRNSKWVLIPYWNFQNPLSENTESLHLQNSCWISSLVWCRVHVNQFVLCRQQPWFHTWCDLSGYSIYAWERMPVTCRNISLENLMSCSSCETQQIWCIVQEECPEAGRSFKSSWCKSGGYHESREGWSLNCFLLLVCQNPKGTVRWVVSHAHWSKVGFMKSSGFRCMAYIMISCSCQVQICMVGCEEASAWVSFLPRHSCHNMSPVYDMAVQKWIGKKLPSSIWSRFTRLGAFLRCLIIACSQERVALRSKMTRATNMCHSR